jgi:F-box interacting protein
MYPKELSVAFFRSVLDIQKSLASIAVSDCSNPKEEAQTANLKLPKSDDTVKTWRSLPVDIKYHILAKLDYLDLYRAKTQSKEFKDLIESEDFHGWRGKAREASLTTLYFFVRNGIWNCEGYDLITKTWMRLPPFTSLPDLDPDSFKDHSICTAGCLICANVGKAQDRLIVFNPLTRNHKELPRLNHRRNPVLMHMVAYSKEEAQYYKVIVAGSSKLGDEHLSKTTEVYDSRTKTWKLTDDLPGPLFALNEHQAGAYANGILYCIAFLEDDQGKGLLAYSVAEEKWRPDLTRPLPYSTSSNIVQLLESDGEIYLFSEIEQERRVEHRIDVLDQTLGQWRSVMTVTEVGNPGLQTYPEYTCVSFGAGKPCAYNTMEDREVVYEEVPSVDFVPAVEDKVGWDHLPREIQVRILGHLPYEQIYQLKTLSKDLKDLVESKESKVITLEEKPSLTACYFFTQKDVLQSGGFDQSTKKWRLLPPLTFFPADCKPDPYLFKEFLVCAKDGLVCINFSKSADKERLIVLNPLSRKYRELPPLNHRRNPVLMHMLVDPASQSYQVIVAGSCSSEDVHTSKITEAYDSRTGKWKRMGDLPEPAFALNEHQAGVFQDGKLFCIGFVEENGQVGKGIIAYDVEEGKWSSKCMHSLSFMSSTTLQLVESNGEVFLFSERIQDGLRAEHWIDKLEWAPGDGDQKNTCQLINVVKNEIRINDWCLETFGPEYTCVPYSDSQLYIFNAYDHTGVVYDIRDPGQSEVVKALPRQYTLNREHMLNSLYPILFTVEPRFSIEV